MSPLRSIGALVGLAAGRVALDFLQAAGSALGAARDLANANRPDGVPHGQKRGTAGPQRADSIAEIETEPRVPAKIEVERILEEMIDASIAKRPPPTRPKPKGRGRPAKR